MLNRRILRIKAFKVLYSYAENPTMDLKEARRQLKLSCEAVRDLYLFMLAVISPLTNEARTRIEAARGKFNPTEEEKHPNLKFVNNSIASILDQDPDFTKIISKKKFSWDQYDAFLRKLYDSIRSKEYFKSYMMSGDSSISEDAALFTRIFEEEFVDSADLESILEDMSIYWNDDLAYSLTYCCHSFADFAAGRRWSLPDLYLDDDNFAMDLLDAAYSGFDRYYGLVAASVPGWDRDRLFVTDLALIITGLAEAWRFSDIPSKVTINEYVEISKFYGTQKSRSFVNGLLDKIIMNNFNKKS